MKNDCSIEKTLQLKCYEGKHRSFCKFDIEDLSQREVEQVIRVRAKSTVLVVLLMFVYISHMVFV